MPDEPVTSALETYPPLLPRTAGRNLPMPEEGAAPAAPPTAPTLPAASSAEAASPETPSEQIPEQATPPPSQSVEDVPFHQHPRWIERQKELEALRVQNQQLLELAQQTAQRPVLAQPTIPVQDIWTGKIDHPDPATAQFWQGQKQLFEMAVEQGKQKAIQEIAPLIDAGRTELAQIKISDFRRSNPDIKPGSEDERSIVAYMNGQMDGVRHPLESAKRNALYDKLDAENRALKSKQSAIPTKAAANVHASAGIPETAGLPATPVNRRQLAGEILDKGGSLTDAASALFGIKRR